MWPSGRNLSAILQNLGDQAKTLLWHTPLAEPAFTWRHRRRSKKQIKAWMARGKPAPPPHAIKAETLRQYASAYRLRTLVETGTQRGAMLAALKHDFSSLVSVELSPRHHDFARRRFRTAPHIELILGDSAAVLPAILARLSEPALFWLDGHYNPGQAPAGAPVSPILTELTHLFAAARLGHVIIIDDVRLFRERTGYPELSAVLALIEQDGGWDVLIQDDSLRLTPARPCPVACRSSR